MGRDWSTSSSTTPSTNSRSPCATASAVHQRLRAQGHGRRRIPSCSTARPTAWPLRRGQLQDRRSDLRQVRARSMFIFVYQDVRGRYMSEGEFVNMTPHRAVKHGPQDIDESTDTYDTIDWLIKNIPNNNGKVGMWGISYPGFYTAAGMIDAHPALKAASPQAPITDWFIGDDFHHNGTLFLPHMFSFFASFGHPRPVPALPPPPGFADRRAHPQDGYSFFLGLGPLTNANEKYFKDDVPFWNEMTQHGTLRRILAGAQPAPAPEEHQARRDDRGRLVRRREPLRRARHLQGDREEQPGRDQHAGDGPLVPRRLVAQRRRLAGQRQVQLQDRGLLSRADRVAVLQVLPEGQGRSQTARGLRLRDRHQPVAQATTPGRPSDAQPKTLYLHAGGRLAFDAPTRKPRHGLRRVRQRPRQAGALHRRPGRPG